MSRIQYSVVTSSLAVSYPSFGQVVGGQFDLYSVTSRNSNVVLPHFARYVRGDFVAIVQFDFERSVGERIGYYAFHFNLFFFRH